MRRRALTPAYIVIHCNSFAPPCSFIMQCGIRNCASNNHIRLFNHIAASFFRSSPTFPAMPESLITRRVGALPCNPRSSGACGIIRHNASDTSLALAMLLVPLPLSTTRLSAIQRPSRPYSTRYPCREEPATLAAPTFTPYNYSTTSRKNLSSLSFSPRWHFDRLSVEQRLSRRSRKSSEAPKRALDTAPATAQLVL